jgi:2-methylcitrate dehydratase PrpD
LEGSILNGGFCQITTGGKQNLVKLTENLGNPYSIMDVYFKPYTACRHTHGSAQAVLELMQEQPINIEEIEQIEVFTYGIATVAVGKGVKEQCVVSAQF